MSLRTVLRLPMIAILTLIVAGPSAAQVAPIPRQAHTEMRLKVPELGPLMLPIEFAAPIQWTGKVHDQLFSLSVGLFGEMLDVAPMPREVPRIIIQSEEEIFQVEDPAQLRIKPLPVAPSTPHGPVQRAMQQEFGIAPQSGNSPFSVQFLCAPPAGQCLPACNSMTYTWGYHRSIPQRLVLVPRMTARLDCGFLTPCPVEAECPGIIVTACLPNGFSELPYPLSEARPVCRGGPGGWWLEEVRVPQPKCRAPEDASPQDRWDWRDRFSYTAVEKEIGSYHKPSHGLSGELSGTWYREIEGAVIAATFSGDELTLCIKRCENGQLLTFTLSADYAVTKDGTVHGVVTGADVKFDRESKAPGLTMSTTASISAELQATVDCPFAFRIRRTSSGVIVSNLKLAGEAIDKEALAMACGMFKYAADGMLPPPKATSSERSCETPTLLSGRYLKHYPQYYPPDSVQPLPREIASQADPDGLSKRGEEFVPSIISPAAGHSVPPSPSIKPPKPANVPAGDFGMMSEVFGQMLGAKSQPWAATVAIPPPVVTTAPVPPMAFPTPLRIESPR